MNDQRSDKMKAYKNYKDYWTKKDSDGYGGQIVMAEKWSETRYRDTEWLNDLIPLYDINSVIDIGAGTGRNYSYFKRHNVKYTGFEISDVLYPLLVANVSNAVKGDIVHDVAWSNVSDLVYTTRVLQHIPPRYIENAIENMIKMSKGYIALISWYDVGAPVDGMEADYHDGSHSNSFRHDYPALFKKYGLTVLKYIDIPYPTGNHGAWFLSKLIEADFDESWEECEPPEWYKGERVSRTPLKSYHCDKCGRNHKMSSKIGRKHYVSAANRR